MKKAQGVAILGFMLFLASCTTGLKNQNEPELLSNFDSLNKDSVVLDVKFVSQPDTKLCGVAVVDMLTGYYQRPIEAPKRETLVTEANAENGMSGAKIKEFLERENYFAAILPGTLDREVSGLYHHLDNKRPLVVMLGTRNPDFFHYVVVSGYSATAKNLVVLDPARGSYVLNEDIFLKKWQKAGRFMLVANPNNLRRVL